MRAHPPLTTHTHWTFCPAKLTTTMQRCILLTHFRIKEADGVNKLLRVTGSASNTVGIPALIFLTPKHFSSLFSTSRLKTADNIFTPSNGQLFVLSLTFPSLSLFPTSSLYLGSALDLLPCLCPMPTHVQVSFGSLEFLRRGQGLIPALDVDVSPKAKPLDIPNIVESDPYFTICSIFNSIGTNNCPTF